MSESTTLSSRNQQPNPETSDRNWDEGGAQKLERQLFFALLGGMLLRLGPALGMPWRHY